MPKPPLHSFYESFSSSLQTKVSSNSSIPKVIQTKKCVVVKPAISKNNLIQVTASSSETSTGTPTYVTFKPAIQNNKSFTNNSIQRAEGGTILLGNRQYQLVKGSTGQMKAFMNGTNILFKSPSNAIIKCYSRNCNNSATIMCSSCTTVKYCSHNCQRRDWYDKHINECERFLNIRRTRT
uniref:MYND-type domain-containing protein n=2 Tax=Schizaphis graminum TaxID=13262 RepID=A0A2S2P9M4_SCHGA